MTEAVIKNIDIPFWRVVAILVKWSIAAIPALVIVWAIVMVIAMATSTLLGVLFGHMSFAP